MSKRKRYDPDEDHAISVCRGVYGDIASTRSSDDNQPSLNELVSFWLP